MKIIRQYLIIIFCFFGIIGAASHSHAEETSHFAFVKEYIRELAANENTRSNAEREFNESKSTHEQISGMIHSNTVIQLELKSQINMIESMHLDPPFETIIPTLISLCENKIILHQNLIDISSTFIAGPRQDLEYGKLLAEIPKIRANVDNINHTLFISTPLIFATLIDQKPDSKNHLSHLIITKEERKELVNDLTTAFGKKLEQKNQNYFVSCASILKSYLSKDYKCSDEPWE